MGSMAHPAPRRAHGVPSDGVRGDEYTVRWWWPGTRERGVRHFSCEVGEVGEGDLWVCVVSCMCAVPPAKPRSPYEAFTDHGNLARFEVILTASSAFGGGAPY